MLFNSERLTEDCQGLHVRNLV